LGSHFLFQFRYKLVFGSGFGSKFCMIVSVRFRLIIRFQSITILHRHQDVYDVLVANFLSKTIFSLILLLISNLEQVRMNNKSSQTALKNYVYPLILSSISFVLFKKTFKSCDTSCKKYLNLTSYISFFLKLLLKTLHTSLKLTNCFWNVSFGLVVLDSRGHLDLKKSFKINFE